MATATTWPRLRIRPPQATVNPIAANSATGPENPGKIQAHQRPKPMIAGAFFAPALTCNGGCAWETFGSAGFLYLRFLSLRIAATLSPENEKWQLSFDTGSSQMNAIDPSVIRRAATPVTSLHALDTAGETK